MLEIKTKAKQIDVAQTSNAVIIYIYDLCTLRNTLWIVTAPNLQEKPLVVGFYCSVSMLNHSYTGSPSSLHQW